MPAKTKKNILETTLALIDKKPFHQISTKEIAKESKIAEITLFRHFSNKESLYEMLTSKFFQMIIGFDSNDITCENEFRDRLVKYFSKSINSNPVQRKLFKVFLHVGMYRKDIFFKYAKVYEEQIAGPIEQVVKYGRNHWGYRKNVDIEISVRLLINSIGFFNIIQNVFLLREVKPYNINDVIQIGVDNFLRSLK